MRSPLSAVFGLFSKDLGIDLGTANTLVFVKDQEIISEPSVVAVHRRTHKVLAIGTEAKAMVGRTPAGVVAMRPLRSGVIADFEIVESMLRYFIAKVHEDARLTPRPRVVIGIPSGVTQVERRAVSDAAAGAGAREAYLIEEPIAAAMGCNLPIAEPAGSMIVDIGGGTTEVAVISLGGMVVSKSLRVAGDEMDDMISQHMRHERGLLIGDRTAEQTKIEAASAIPQDEERTLTLRGRDVVTGLAKAVDISTAEIREAIQPAVTQIVDTVAWAIEQTPPEIVADIMQQGIFLTGGGALLTGLDALLERETRMPVRIASDPLTSVVRGTVRCFEQIDTLKKVLVGQNHRGR